MHSKTDIDSGMRNKNGCKVWIVVISLRNWEVGLYKQKGAAAAAVGVHRNTLSAIRDRGVIGDWLVVMVEEK